MEVTKFKYTKQIHFTVPQWFAFLSIPVCMFYENNFIFLLNTNGVLFYFGFTAEALQSRLEK